MGIDRLTARQQEVADLLAQGLSNKEIARELNIAHGTVKVHLYEIFQKCGVSSRTRLARLLVLAASGKSPY